MNPLPSGALPVNALTVCWQITKSEQKALTASVSEMETQMSAFAEDTDRAQAVSGAGKEVYRFF